MKVCVRGGWALGVNAARRRHGLPGKAKRISLREAFRVTRNVAKCKKTPGPDRHDCARQHGLSKQTW